MDRLGRRGLPFLHAHFNIARAERKRRELGCEAGPVERRRRRERGRRDFILRHADGRDSTNQNYTMIFFIHLPTKKLGNTKTQFYAQRISLRKFPSVFPRAAQHKCHSPPLSPSLLRYVCKDLQNGMEWAFPPPLPLAFHANSRSGAEKAEGGEGG